MAKRKNNWEKPVNIANLAAALEKENRKRDAAGLKKALGEMAADPDPHAGLKAAIAKAPAGKLKYCPWDVGDCYGGPGKSSAVVLLDKAGERRLRIAAKTHRILVGIDPGTNTGFAVWLRRERSLQKVQTLTIYQAIKAVEALIQPGSMFSATDVLVRVEDARKRGADPTAKNIAKAQGAGSVKRDSAIWQEILEALGVDYELLAPKPARTKWTPAYFQQITGWTGITSNHARDAAALVYGL